MKELNFKLNKSDAANIWKHFDRFALYNDLKDLYGKTIPELVKFEQKIINFQAEFEQ